MFVKCVHTWQLLLSLESVQTRPVTMKMVNLAMVVMVLCTCHGRDAGDRKNPFFKDVDISTVGGVSGGGPASDGSPIGGSGIISCGQCTYGCGPTHPCRGPGVCCRRLGNGRCPQPTC
eukprot:GFUD01083714.1.p1 GENE.GFUD01083714.1~~GFUD01083714.1.p1  ORF type:complete len:118 (+),score=13.95 GFUD01083714.1:59-412(+)